MLRVISLTVCPAEVRELLSTNFLSSSIVKESSRISATAGMNSVEVADTSYDLEELALLATQERQKLLEDLIQLRKNDFAYLSSVHLAPDQSFYVSSIYLEMVSFE